MLKVPDHRFIKFGLVGASGVLVNLAALGMCQELLFAAVSWERLRLNLSLAVAIGLSTFSNYYWNRLWTWRDRKETINKGFWGQMLEYFAVCWLAIALQVGCTNLLQLWMHYLPANAAAIVVAAVVNFKANDALTFSGRSFIARIALPLKGLGGRGAGAQ